MTEAVLSGSRDGTATAGTRSIWFFEDGSGDMKDLLGGKGAGLAEMTRAGLPVPPGFTLTTEVCLEFYEAGRQFPDGLVPRDPRLDARARAAHRQGLRQGPEPAAGIGAQRRARLDARDDGHDPQPRAQRRHRPRAREADVERPFRVRRIPAVHGDVRQRRAGHSEGRVRPRRRGGEAESARRNRSRARREQVEGSDRAVPRDRARPHRQAVPAGRVRAARARDRGGVRLVALQARRRLPQVQQDPRRLGHGVQRRARWSSATWARTRGPASRSLAIRTPARRCCSASTCATRRAKTSSRGSARR